MFFLTKQIFIDKIDEDAQKLRAMGVECEDNVKEVMLPSIINSDFIKQTNPSVDGKFSIIEYIDGERSNVEILWKDLVKYLQPQQIKKIKK